MKYRIYYGYIVTYCSAVHKLRDALAHLGAKHVKTVSKPRSVSRNGPGYEHCWHSRALEF